MANLSRDEVLKIASLANLTLTDTEIDNLSHQLSSIVSYVDELKRVDTSSVLPTSQTTGLENIAREDVVDAQRILSQDDALSGTENVHNGSFMVPLILTNKES